MVLGEYEEIGTEAGPGELVVLILALFNWRNQTGERATKVGERETERGAARRREEGRGRREEVGQAGGGEGGARNEKLGVGGKQHSEAQVAELGESSHGPEPRGRRA